MQLRVARLCLDCEELYVGESCPICASERFAFLSRWLPTEERRRWRGPAPSAVHGTPHALQTVKRLFFRWIGEGDSQQDHNRLRTRASDSAPRLDFEEPAGNLQKLPAHSRQPLKEEG
jgi:hypothetical protein